MKKFHGTKYAHIGPSYTPLMDAEIERVETLILNQQARIKELTLQIKRLLEIDPEQDA